MAAGGRAMLWAVVAAAVTVAGGQTTEAAAACGTGPSVAATVFAILLLLALAALGIVMYQYIWKPRHCPSLEKVVLAENGQQEGRFAFDNPYMTEDDDIGSKSTLPCHDILAINEKTGTSRSGDFRTPKKHGFCVLTPTSSQPRGPSADDPTVNEAEQVLVPLKGHDFTGLGFTVQGGMREGIFVNTVSQHGPALESGLVQPGDRVTAVTVSFSHITLEDAMAILSQSSPYNVQLHLQKTGPGGGPKKVTTPTGTGDRRHQSSSDLSEGKSHRSGRPDKSPATGSSTSSDTSTQHERKTVVEARAVDSDPRKETVQHVQRDPSASFADSPSGGYREMAVDVPEHMDSSHKKQDTEASSGPSSTARARHLGVQVLPPLTPAGGAGAGTGGSVTPGSESRDGRRSVALGVPSLRLASRDSTESGHCVEACLTKVANDQPCSRDLDDETGEPSTPGTEDADHRRVRMGTSSFNKQERLQKKEMEEQPDKPEPAKRQRDVTVEAQAKAEVEPQNKTTESEKGDVSRSPMSPEEESSRHPSRDSVSPERHTSEKKPEDEVEFQKLSSEFRTLIQEDNTEHNEIKPGRDNNRSSAEKEYPRSRKSSSSSSSRSGRSSPVQERPKEMTDIPDEMRLAAGVAQDRRSRVDRPARNALFSSTEVLVEQQKTPTEEKPATVYIDPEEDDQETSDDERPSPVATPRTVTPATRTTETRKEDSDDNDEDLMNQKNDTDEKLSSIQKEVEDVEEDPVNEKPDSDSEVEDSKTKVKGERLSSSYETEEKKISQPVEEEELKKTVRSIDAYQDDPPSSKMKIDKLEAFKEVLSLTPSKSPPEKRTMRDHEDDLVGETIEKSHIDRCPCDGPTLNGTAPRITGEVTGLVEVGEKKSAKTEPVVTAATESNPPPAEADERTAPPTSAAVSRARSEAAALPETVRAVRAVRRRDSGGPVAEVLSRDAAASGRLCASTGDLTRSEPPRADSPLGRTVSMHIGVGDQAGGDSRVSAAACARDQMDLSRLQEGYGVAQPRHIMSTASSNESLDTESIQEEPENAVDQPPQQETNNNGTNHHGPAEGEIAAPSAVRIETSEKEITEEIKVNGIDGVEGHVGGREEHSRHNSEDVNVTMEVRVPPALPRIVQSELKRSSESESSDGREEPTPVDSPTPRPSTADETIITQSETPATVASPIVIESAPEPVPDSSITDEVRIVQSELKRSSESESSDGREEPALVDSPTPRPSTADETIITQFETLAAVAPPIVIELAPEPITDSTAGDVTIDSTSVAIPSTTASDPVQSTGEGASDTGSVPPDAGAAGETTPVARSRRGPPPTPPPRSPASRQVAPPGSPREPDRFEISALELDSVMISHEEFLRQEAERRAHVCRLAANFKSSREPSPAPE